MENQNKVNWLVIVLLMVISFMVGGVTAYFLTMNNLKNESNITQKLSEGTSSTVAEGQSNTTGNDVAQCPTYDSPPVITSITPSSGPVGTVIEVHGCNFLGFEGDKILSFTNSKGGTGVLNGQMDELTRTSNTVLRVKLSQKICQFNSYSGLDCPELELVPGVYTVYSGSYGGKSNTVNFTVTAQ